jgi:Rha family phage regulatory protein
LKEALTLEILGVFCDKNDTARVSSLTVASVFGKDHDKVMRDIKSLDCSDEFNTANFGDIRYTDSRGRKQDAVSMTRDGFMFLVMGYRGKAAAAIKEAYIKRFNEMEKYIVALVNARVQFPRLTETIKMLHDNPKPYHFSNECDMLNRLVLGMTAKQFKVEHELPADTKSIRPFLTVDEIEKLDLLQSIDIGLLISTPDFNQRKRHLEWYLSKKLTA